LGVQTAIKIAYYAYIVAILSPVKQGKQLPCVRMWRHRSSHNNFIYRLRACASSYIF